jgi:hypothetical protein
MGAPVAAAMVSNSVIAPVDTVACTVKNLTVKAIV